MPPKKQSKAKSSPPPQVLSETLDMPQKISENATYKHVNGAIAEEAKGVIAASKVALSGLKYIIIAIVGALCWATAHGWIVSPAKQPDLDDLRTRQGVTNEKVEFIARQILVLQENSIQNRIWQARIEEKLDALPQKLASAPASPNPPRQRIAIKKLSCRATLFTRC